MLITSLLASAPSGRAQTKPDSSLSLKVSPDAPKEPVKYKAKDSIRFELQNQRVFLYGLATVSYQNTELTAGYIELDIANNQVYARGLTDSSGKISQQPIFKQEEQSFQATEMRYNFKTKKGKITEVTTQEGEGFIQGQTIKKDSNNTTFIQGGFYTTCNLKHPHFCIKAGKLKIIPNDKIVTGPAYLSIADIPTPLGLPFGFFPNKKGRSSGFLIPAPGENYLGFFLRDGGYYWGISDNFDLTLRGDIYSKGSWSSRAMSHYIKRYKYNGFLNLSFNSIKEGIRESTLFQNNQNFNVRWTHQQDPKAHPGSRFSADVNAGSSFYNQFNPQNANAYLNRSLNSSINYYKSWIGTPFNLSVAGRHSQNAQTRSINIALPEIAFSMNRITPFKPRKSFSTKWYTNIGLNYTLNARNEINTTDSLFFKSETYNNLRNGIRHSLPIGGSFQVLKYFSLSSYLNLNSNWYFKTTQRNYDPLLQRDTAAWVNGLRTANDYSFNTNLNTKFYGMYALRGKRKIQIRHVLTPNVGFTYRPDFSKSQYGYFKTVQSNALGALRNYSIFENGIYGGPGSGENALLTYSVNNFVDMKRRTLNDTGSTSVKSDLIQGFNISGFYNIAAPTFKWSAINMDFRTKLFKYIDVYSRGSFDPYAIDTNGKRINRFAYQANNEWLRFTNGEVSVGTTLSGGRKKQTPPANASTTNPQELEYIRLHPEEYIDFNIPWTFGFQYNLYYLKHQNTGSITQSLSFRGDANITKNWKIGFNTGYDFKAAKLIYTSLNVYRDLHCWEMKINYTTSQLGPSYTVDINVKSSVLQDLKLTRRRNWYDYK